MAIYHCSIKIIGRSAGRSSVAAAAYRSAECITNDYDGIVHDFRKKNWVDYKEIIIPSNAPKEYMDRRTLWNAVELAEKSQDAQLAREFELALPVELTREQQIEVVREYVEKYLVSQGMVADIAIHNPPRTNDRHQPIDVDGNVTKNIEEMLFNNPHAHILCTVRPIDENGRWEKKSEVEYLCAKCGEEKAFTAKEFVAAKTEGWEKQYRYYEGKNKVYYTTSEADRKGLERISRTPKTTPYGRKNEKVEYWNAKDRIYEWRIHWELILNAALKEIQSEAKVDSRSFNQQGREDEIPTVHMGVAALNIEKRADREVLEGKKENDVMRSEIGDINREIREHNKFVYELREKLDELVKKAQGYIDEIAKKLESIRIKLIGNNYEKSLLSKQLFEIELKRDNVSKYELELNRINAADKESSDIIKQLSKELKACTTLQISKKNNIKSRIQNEQKAIEYRAEYKQSLIDSFMINPSQKAIKIQEIDNEKKKISEDVENLDMDSNSLKHEYENEIEAIPEHVRKEVIEEQKGIRHEYEKLLEKKLASTYGSSYHRELLSTSITDVDQSLNPVQMESQRTRNRKRAK